MVLPHFHDCCAPVTLFGIVAAESAESVVVVQVVEPVSSDDSFLLEQSAPVADTPKSLADVPLMIVN